MAILYSSKPVSGQFVYRDRFAIRPLTTPPQAPFPLFDHPFVVQFESSYNEHYPWTKHLWDEIRLSKLERGTQHLPSKDKDSWKDAHKQISEMRIPSAIVNELIQLISFLSNSQIKRPTGDSTWAVNADAILPNRVIESSFPVICNFADATESAMEFGAISAAWDAIARTTRLNEFSVHQHAYIVGNEFNRLELPSSVEILLDKYFELDSKTRLATYTAIACYYKALRMRSDHPTLALLSLSMGIECLVNSIKQKLERCATCNAPAGIERCEECGAPVYRLKSEFVAFMKKYVGPGDEPLYRQLYDVRSTSVHGELLRAEFQDTGFHVGGRDEQQLFLETSTAVTRFAIIRWIHAIQ